ncbi:hypothetical protein FF38_04191 [Lucilia cuprina]|uniref:SAM domain-containing protein n=1 Tax=Lucilia cuprina TaxID=7375 RepID=A0A0L0CQK3_LUCCU|nr:hypothetical protein FF38_04191 [Lucilia cuprina]
MSSWMDQIIAPYLASPLANSTKIHNNVYTDGPDISLTRLGYRSTGYQPINITQAAEKSKETKETTNTDESIEATDTSTTSNNESTNKTSAKSKTMKGAGKKPVVSRKSITAKKTIEPIKAVAINCKNNGVTVEKILKQINMTKYQQAFKKIDVSKFKSLKEIDLNAIGITRPSEIRTFMDAIKKVKSDTLIIKQN